MLNANASSLPAGASLGVPAPDPVPLETSERGWTWWLGAAFSLAVLVAVLVELRNVDFSDVRDMLPTSPLFWMVFAISYLSAPFADWLIFRRLWRMPISGLGALLRKLIGNELLFGYAGELYLYTWARRRTAMTSAPFGAIKDVAILSALAGNAVTIAMLALAYPLLGQLHLGIDSRTLLMSTAVVLASSSAILLFRKTLFSLPRADLWFVTGIHLARIFIGGALTAFCWHLVLPQVAIEWWLLLSALRMLLSRLPLLPNKDIVFAGLAVFLIGHDADMGALMTMMASVILATHLGLGVALVAADAANWRRR
ncbi:MAG: hypothetical protein DCF31_13865 [Alphaproteobacteria bacterium]|nr:MAG: hypothetical protein DCF31_13865 [Alphaproteobacteria bacterium]